LNLPKLSIAAKLYAIFALMATTTLIVAVIALLGARHHAAFTERFESANAGSWNVERVNGLIYAVEARSRAIYLAADRAAAADAAADLEKVNDQIGAVISEWQGHVTDKDAALFSNFAVRLSGFQVFPRELARIAAEQGPLAARDFASQRDRPEIREALSRDLTRLSEVYANRARRLYTQLDEGIDRTAMMTSLFTALAMLLALAGGVVLARSVTRPLDQITRVTEAVAAGSLDTAVPFESRHDEVGALARSIGVFQNAMRRNIDLNSTVLSDADARSRRQEKMGSEIVRFSAEVETTLAELGRLSEEMLTASKQLSNAAADAAKQTARATDASNGASANVRDIASAADELSVSVNEIDRQVAQSNAIASKAVEEAERTNGAVTELNEAARKIGDVIKLITDIAEQTNLLALNATIEAARAGEAGRGFAVVAGEVKALAGQTGRATEEIGAQIAAMQAATTRATDAITGIERTIREIGEISSAIAAAVTEQGAATQEIARGVEVAAQRTAETAEEVGRVGFATDDTHFNADAVRNVANGLGEVAQRIRGQVDQFFERLRA
jgi:methyl-accepting chemotaxis protein